MPAITRYIVLACFFLLSALFLHAQNVGIGQALPVSKLDVNGGLTVGATYSGSSAAPASGAIIEGNTGIGTASPAHRLHVVGDVRIQGDFVNQQVISTHDGATQNIPFTNAVITPLNNTVNSITITDGNGVNNSSVLITGFARVFGGSLVGGNYSYGGYFMILQRANNPAFTGVVNLTYTAGTCYIEAPDGFGSSAFGFGGGGAVTFVDDNLTAGTTYYYRLAFYSNGFNLTGGTYDVWQRDLAVIQIKR